MKKIECCECGEFFDQQEFYQPESKHPFCKNCADGFWEMMGDDPHGKNWAN